MKKLFTFLMLCSTAVCFSQVEFGAKAGANYSIYKGEHLEEYYEYKPGFYVGGFVNVVIEGNLNVQADVLLSQTRTILNYTERPYNFKRTVTDYDIAVPVMLQYNFFGFYAEAGGAG